MKLVSAEIHGYDKTTGARVMDVFLVSDSTPSTLPTTGEGIEGLQASDTFAPLSILYISGTGDVYTTNESGQFTIPQ
jgi:hypothetical protein